MFLPVYIWHGRGSWHLGYITPCLDMPCMAMCTVDRWMSTFQGGGLPVFQVQIRWIANAPLSLRSSSLSSSDRWVSVDRSNPPGSPPSFDRPVVLSDPRFVPRLPRCSFGLHRAVDRPTQKDNQAETETETDRGRLTSSPWCVVSNLGRQVATTYPWHVCSGSLSFPGTRPGVGGCGRE